ncbi:MAG: Crp/Fnr family transcriptional regulator [Elusimicrobiota bacterium]
MAITTLRRFGLFQKLPAKQLKRILSISHTRNYEAGEVIFEKGEAAKEMFIVMSGRVKIFIRSGWKKSKTFAYLGRGDFFGEMAIIEDKPRSAGVQAVEPCRMLVIHKGDFKRLLLSDPKLSIYMLKALSQRLRGANEDIENMLFRNILGRLAKTFRDLAGGDTTSCAGAVVLKQRYSQQELADLVGTTREPLSRALGILRRAGIVETRGGRVTLKDLTKLESLIFSAIHPED